MSFRRVAGIAGILTAVLEFVFMVVLGGDDPDPDASGAEVIAWLSDNQGLTEFRMGLGAASIFFAIIFIVGLGLLLRSHERREDGWSIVGFTGGLLSMAMFGAAIAAFAVLVIQVEDIDPALASVLWDFEGGSLHLVTGTMAVMALGFGVAIIRSRALPAWIGWFALGVTALSVVPAVTVVPTAELTGVSGALAMISGAAFSLWVLVIALWMAAGPSTADDERAADVDVTTASRSTAVSEVAESEESAPV